MKDAVIFLPMAQQKIIFAISGRKFHLVGQRIQHFTRQNYRECKTQFSTKHSQSQSNQALRGTKSDKPLPLAALLRAFTRDPAIRPAGDIFDVRGISRAGKISYADPRPRD